MDNAEEVMHSLEEFSKLKPKDIPRELDDYLGYVAKTGDPVFKWSIIKCLFREKLLSVITDFYESTLTIELPPCPNVDTFNYERMKANLLEKLDSFHGAPFTVQRISELLTNPRKEYNRADKFMRAIEKNILVVSIREPGRYSEIDGDNQADASFNGIPEPNDTEPSFTCNDLADPESSSQVYEVVNSDTHDPSYTVNVDTTNVVSEIPVTVENDSLKEDGNGSGTSSDDSQEENVVEVNSENSETNNSSEKENESVICSTVTVQSIEEEKPQTEITSDNSSQDSAMNCDTTPIVNDSSTVSEKETIEPEKETCTASSTEEDIIDSDSTKVACADLETSNQLNTLSETSNIETDTEEIISNSEPISSNKPEQTETTISEEVCDPVLLPTEENTSSVLFIDDRTVDCDTSNSFDSESNCDPENNELPPSTNQETVTSEVCVLEEENEITSCVENVEEKKTEDVVVTDDNSRETSVIHTTSNPEYTESMEMEECQISVADETSH